MVRIGILLFSLMIGAVTTVQSQSIKGKLSDLVDNKPLVAASLSLTSRTDSTRAFSAISDNAGAFEFTGLPVDSFLLQISSVGFDDYRAYVEVTDSIPNVDLGNLLIPKENKELGVVVIRSITPPTTQRGDTVQFNASQFKVNPDASAEDMMKKMPGVTVDRSGTVTAQGEQVRKVTIDGREFFGDDATAALRNLPAEVIDKIQVFDRLSEQAQLTGFDDGNAVRAINIVTKADMRNGQFGRLYAGYGTDDRYSAGGNMTFFNGTRRISVVGQTNNINQQNFSSQDLMGVTSTPRGGGGGRGGGGRPGGGGPGGNFGGGGSRNFTVGQADGISKTNAMGINYSDQWAKKIEVSGSYFFNQNNNLNNQLLNREYFLSGDSSQFYRENSITESDNSNHRFNMRMEYKIDSFNTLIYTPRFRTQKVDAHSTYSSDLTFDPADSISQSRSNESSLSNSYSIDNEILYRHAFRSKRGRSISMNIEFEVDRNSGEDYVESLSRYFKTPTFTDTIRQFADRVSTGKEISGNFSYTEPLGKKGQLQFNYRPSFSDNKSTQETYHYDDASGKYTVFDEGLSNKFDNTYTSHSGGVSYRVGDRDNMFNIGLNYQRANLSGEQTFPYFAKVDRSFGNFLPNIMWRKKMSTKSSINIYYRSRTNEPSISQLQNVVDISNILFPRIGNPELKQDYSHTLVTRFTYTNAQKRTSLFANVYVQNTQDYISNGSFMITEDSVISGSVTLREGSRLTKPVNLDGYWSLRSFLTYGMPLNFIKSNLNWNAGFSYVRTPGLIEDQHNLSRSLNYSVGAVVASNISEFIDFTVSYSANFNIVKNSIQPELNNNYFNHIAGAQINLLTKSGWVYQNDLSNQMYRGLTDGFNQDYWLWNMSIAKKFLKDQKGELKLSVFDLLKQNQAIRRTATESYIEDLQNDVLQQYFMLTFTYKLRNFGPGRAAR